MSITVTFPATLMVRFAKIDEDLPVTLNEANIRYFVEYGAKQAGNDKHAGVALKDYATKAEFLDVVRKRATEWIGKMNLGQVPGSKEPSVVRKIATELGGTMTDEDFAAVIAARKAREAEAAKEK